MKYISAIFLLLVFCIFFCSCGHNYKTKQTYRTDDELIDSVITGATLQSVQERPLLEAKILTLNEPLPQTETTKKNALKTPVFKLTARNFKPGEMYTCYEVNLTRQKKFRDQFSVTKEGRLFSTSKMSYIEDNHITCGKVTNGEPIFIVLVSSDKSIGAVAILQPNPIEYIWEDGAKVIYSMITPDASNFSMIWSGFIPNEEIILASTSCDEKGYMTFKADSKGDVTGIFSPAVIGYSGGQVKLRISRVNFEDTIITFNWGTNAKLTLK